jgi:LysM repeat protein
VIADEHDTTVEQLLALNPDVDPVALTVGQRIRVK